MTNDKVNILQDSSKWNSSIMNRLYYDDCDGMSHYRLVYESTAAITSTYRFVDADLRRRMVATKRSQPAIVR